MMKDTSLFIKPGREITLSNNSDWGTFLKPLLYSLKKEWNYFNTRLLINGQNISVQFFEQDVNYIKYFLKS